MDESKSKAQLKYAGAYIPNVSHFFEGIGKGNIGLLNILDDTVEIITENADGEAVYYSKGDISADMLADMLADIMPQSEAESQGQGNREGEKALGNNPNRKNRQRGRKHLPRRRFYRYRR